MGGRPAVKRTLLRLIVGAMAPSEHLTPRAYRSYWLASFVLALTGGLLYLATSSG
jgi:hypothetical protein